MANLGSQHCANCIGTLSFPMAASQVPKSRCTNYGHFSSERLAFSLD